LAPPSVAGAGSSISLKAGASSGTTGGNLTLDAGTGNVATANGNVLIGANAIDVDLGQNVADTFTRILGNLCLGPAKSITLSNGNNNNVDLRGSSFWFITGPSAGFTLTGMVAPAKEGSIVIIYTGANTNTWSVTNNDTGNSSAVNCIMTNTGATISFATGVNAFIYCNTTEAGGARWVRLFSNG
jgi:hypothetical protein